MARAVKRTALAKALASTQEKSKVRRAEEEFIVEYSVVLLPNTELKLQVAVDLLVESVVPIVLVLVAGAEHVAGVPASATIEHLGFRRGVRRQHAARRIHDHQL